MRLRSALGIVLRSFGWVLFGLIMVVSFGSLVNLPPGMDEFDQWHPLALTAAVAACALCWAVARFARPRHVRTWPFRPVTLRVVAMLSAFAISWLAIWQAEQQNQKWIKGHVGNTSATTRH